MKSTHEITLPDGRWTSPNEGASTTLGELPQQPRHFSEFRVGALWPGPRTSQVLRVEFVASAASPMIVVGLDIARTPVPIVDRPQIGFFTRAPGLWFAAVTDDCTVLTPVSCALAGTQWSSARNALFAEPGLPELALAIVDDGEVLDIDRYPSHPNWWHALRSAMRSPGNIGDISGFVAACAREAGSISAGGRMSCPIHFADDDGSALDR